MASVDIFSNDPVGLGTGRGLGDTQAERDSFDAAEAFRKGNAEYREGNLQSSRQWWVPPVCANEPCEPQKKKELPWCPRTQSDSLTGLRGSQVRGGPQVLPDPLLRLGEPRQR